MLAPSLEIQSLVRALSYPCDKTLQSDLQQMAVAFGGERAAAIQFEIVTHERIFSAAILLRWRVKTNSSSMGLPGKFPVSRLVTTVSSSF